MNSYQFFSCVLNLESVIQVLSWSSKCYWFLINQVSSSVGLIEYSEETLCVLMLCLRGLFNSANRHKKACVNHAAEVAIHCWDSVWRGSAPSADLCELNVALSPGLCPTGGWTPNFTYAYGTLQLSIYANALFELAMKNIFPNRLRGFHKELNHDLLCYNTCWLCGLWSKTWAEFKDCPFEIGEQSVPCLIYCTHTRSVVMSIWTLVVVLS